MTKARIFIDYWNFQISMIDIQGDKYRVDWKKFSPWLIESLQQIIGSKVTFEGTRVYMSYDPRNPNDKPLIDWANNFLDRVSGVDVIMQERKVKRPPRCPSCHEEILTCPHCKAPMVGTIEKGVDTAIVTDLLGLAWEGAWNYAILISSDRDFIPAVELLNRKGFQVINAHFPPMGMDLAKKCWASIDLHTAFSDIEYFPK
jgi:uncharacterized LabA/DUF88 family protein